MEIKKGQLIHQDKCKKVYASSDEDYDIYVFQDEFEENGQKIKMRGKVNANITAVLYKYLASHRVQTHFSDMRKPGELIVLHTEALPVKIKIWNYASGDLCQRFPFDKWSELSCPILEYYLVDDSKNTPMVHFDHLCALDLISIDELQFLDRISRKVNAVLKSYFSRRSLLMANCEIMFGRKDDQLILSDAITLDSVCLLDLQQSARPNANRFDMSKDNLEEKYQLINTRIGG